MDIFVGRQPVLTREKKTFGYELLFRDGVRNAFPGIDYDTATSKVLDTTFFSMDFSEITGNRPGAVNFTKELILQKIPMVFPKDKLIIEILENIEPDGDIVAEFRELRKKGYRLALDDFVFNDRYADILDLFDIIKFDVLATPLDKLSRTVAHIRSNCKSALLAEKVETHEMFEKAKQMGFSLFQGYFFSKPEVLSGRQIPSSQLTRLELIAETGRPSMDVEKLNDIIRKDLSVSYKLLRFINSAYFRRTSEINTVRDAILYLGVGEVKKFIQVVVAAGLSENKPDELVRLSLMRARICELVGKNFNIGFYPEELFVIGLFSLMDAMLDREMAQVLKQVSFSEKIKKALLGKNPAFNRILSEIACFEKGDRQQCREGGSKADLFRKKLPDFYLDAVKMADAFFA